MQRRLKRLRRIDRRTTTPYDIFMLAVTFLSFINLACYIFLEDSTFLYTLGAIDIILSFLFLIDFARLFITAPKKGVYFFKEYGWADLLAAVPFPQFNILRIFRLVKVVRIIRRLGIKNMLKEFNENRALTALLALLLIIILLLEFGSVGILAIERGASGANILTPSDALWWVIVTIATVGYGDLYPVTNEGRIFASFVMVIGVGLFGVVTGYLSRKFIVASKEEKKQQEAADAQKDAIIAGLKSELQEIRTLIENQQGSRKS